MTLLRVEADALPHTTQIWAICTESHEWEWVAS